MQLLACATLQTLPLSGARSFTIFVFPAIPSSRMVNETSDHICRTQWTSPSKYEYSKTYIVHKHQTSLPLPNCLVLSPWDRQGGAVFLPGVLTATFFFRFCWCPAWSRCSFSWWALTNNMLHCLLPSLCETMYKQRCSFCHTLFFIS